MTQEVINLIRDAVVAIWHSQLLGVLVGALAARYWQAKQWKLDAKKTEYRELLSALSKSTRCLLHYTFLGGPIVTNAEDERRIYEADVTARGTIQDRIFIAAQVQEENILERWQLMAGEKDGSRLVQYWQDMHATLIRLARKDLGI